MRIFKLVLGAVLVMAIVAAGFAHADESLSGTTAAGFLTNGNGPRVLAMGGASLALEGDLQSAAWNPAALAALNGSEFSLAHAGMPGDMQQEWFAGGGRFGHGATRWSVTGLYQGNGSFDGRDATNTPTGSFSASSFAIGLQLAQRFGERASVGVGAKFVNEKLGSVSGSGATFDFGGQMRAGAFGIGAAATNVGGQMRYGDAVYGFPASYGAGVSWTAPMSGLSFAVDANFPKSYYNDVRFGAEWRYKDLLAIRTGYRHEMASSGIQDGLSGPTFGLGAGYNGLWFDYGYLVSSVSGGAEQRIAISFHPGGFGFGGAQMGERGTGASHAPVASKEDARSASKSTKTGSRTQGDAGTVTAPLAAATPAPAALATGGDTKPVTKSTTSTPATTTPATPTDPAPATTAANASPAPAAKAAAPVASAAPKPASTTTVAESAPATPRPQWVTVKAGDTIASIARRFETTIEAIMMENNMVSERIIVGQKLKLPDHH